MYGLGYVIHLCIDMCNIYNLVIRSNNRYAISSKDGLLIKSVQRSDAGNYTCLVKNPEGSDHIIYVLHVQGKLSLSFNLLYLHLLGFKT